MTPWNYRARHSRLVSPFRYHTNFRVERADNEWPLVASEQTLCGARTTLDRSLTVRHSHQFVIFDEAGSQCDGNR